MDTIDIIDIPKAVLKAIFKATWRVRIVVPSAIDVNKPLKTASDIM